MRIAASEDFGLDTLVRMAPYLQMATTVAMILLGVHPGWADDIGPGPPR